MSQAIALWYGYWPGHVSNRQSWFILTREDFKDQDWVGMPPFSRNGTRQLRVDLPFLTEEAALEAVLRSFDPENLFKERKMKQVGFAVKYITGVNAGKYWGRKDHWVVSEVPFVFGLDTDAKKAQEQDEGCQKEVIPIFVEDT